MTKKELIDELSKRTYLSDDIKVVAFVKGDTEYLSEVKNIEYVLKEHSGYIVLQLYI